MQDERLLNRDTQPEPDLIRQIIGKEVFPVWEEVNRYLHEHYPEFEAEMAFFNPQHGWCLDYRQGSQRLCALFPERGGFTVFLTLTQAGEEEAQAKIHYFNARIRTLLNQPSELPQGRWLWLRIEDHTDFVGLKLLIDIKLSGLTAIDSP
jgi:hypothetical protein